MSDTKSLSMIQMEPLPGTSQAYLEQHFAPHYVHVDDVQAGQGDLADCQCLVTAAYWPTTAAMIESMPKLEIISNLGVGFDLIDLAAARARGIVVANTPDVLNDCVADFGIALMLGVARRAGEGERYARAGDWVRKGPMRFGNAVHHKRLGIVGLGRIGRVVARRAAAFDMTVGYCGPSRKDDVEFEYFDNPAALAAWADYLILTCPGGAATLNLIDAAVLRALGPTGFLINIARGSVVDELALLEALRNETIAGAGIDVFAQEPKVPEGFFELDNAYIQPHQGSATWETRTAMGNMVVDNLIGHYRDGAVLSRVV